LEPHVVANGVEKLAEKISIRVSFIFFSFHPMFWFWFRLLVHILNLCFNGTLGISMRFIVGPEHIGINMPERALDFF
jgi:hypothetical protein